MADKSKRAGRREKLDEAVAAAKSDPRFSDSGSLEVHRIGDRIVVTKKHSEN